jgi:hypothetical protein
MINTANFSKMVENNLERFANVPRIIEVMVNTVSPDTNITCLVQHGTGDGLEIVVTIDKDLKTERSETFTFLKKVMLEKYAFTLALSKLIEEAFHFGLKEPT